LIYSNVSKMLSSSTSGTYELAKDAIDTRLETTPMRVVEDMAQTRNNCTTMGQRILFQDVTGDQSLTGRLYAFMTDPNLTPQGVDRLLYDKAMAVQAGNPGAVRALNLSDDGWQPYKSNAGGIGYRYETPFSQDGRITPEMEAFQRSLSQNGVEVQWGEKGGKVYAYVLKDVNPDSYQRLQGQLGITAAPELGNRMGFNPSADPATHTMDQFMRFGLGDENVLNVRRIDGATQVQVPATMSRSKLAEMGIDIAGVSRQADGDFTHTITIPDERLPGQMQQAMQHYARTSQSSALGQAAPQAPEPAGPTRPFDTPLDTVADEARYNQEIDAARAEADADKAWNRTGTRDARGNRMLRPEDQRIQTLVDAERMRSAAAASLDLEGISEQAATRLGVDAAQLQAGNEAARQAGSQSTRVYHNSEHFEDLARGSVEIQQTLTARAVDPQTAQRMGDIYALAGRDHDVAYAGVDGGLPPAVQATVADLIERTPEGAYRIRPEASGPDARIAMQVFGYEPGQTLNPFHGQNEFISTLHSLRTNASLPDADKVALSVMIEQTIPFDHPDSVERTLQRADALGALDANQRRALGMSAAHFANRDVANFAYSAEEFRANTVKLLEEGGTRFNDPENVAMKAGRQADFFQGLVGGLDEGKNAIFRNHGDLMSPQELAERNATARAQIEGSIRDMRAVVVAAEAEHRGVGDISEQARHGQAILETAREQVASRRPAPIAPVTGVDAPAPRTPSTEISTDGAARVIDTAASERGRTGPTMSAANDTATTRPMTVGTAALQLDPEPARAPAQPEPHRVETRAPAAAPAAASNDNGRAAPEHAAPHADAPEPEARPAAPHRPGIRERLDRVGSRVGVATIAVQGAAAVKAYREGDMDAARQHTQGAVVSTAFEAGFSQTGMRVGTEVAAATAERVGLRAAATGLKAAGGKIPVVGAFVGAAFGIGETGYEAYKAFNGESNWKKVGGTFLSGVAGTVGGIVGFGAGEVLQEGVHYGTAAAFGKENAARHSATGELIIMGAELAGVGGNPPRAAVHSAFAGRAGQQHLNKELNEIAGQFARTNWGQHIGNGDRNVTAQELRQEMQQHGITVAEIDRNRDGNITGKEMTDALQAHGVQRDRGGPQGAVRPAQGDWRAEQARAARERQAAAAEAPRAHSSFSGRAGAQHLNAELKDLEGQMARTNWGRFIGNGDANVTVAEMRATMQKHGITVAEIDRNGDGNISGREFTNALQAHNVQKQPVRGGGSGGNGR
ncbi:MAG: hypothetical protein DI582_10515, partial [Azospirillum brasilense]